MLNLLRIGTGLAILLAIVSANLWRELRTERQLNADLRAQAAECANRDPGSMPATQPSNVRAAAIAPAATSGGGIPEPPAAQQSPAINPGVTIPFAPERDLMKDPEYRSARLNQQRMNLKRNYTGVAEEMGLS